MNQMTQGIYPTMVTPYSAGGMVDYDAADSLMDWYYEKGCQGVFAVCQTSELFTLTREEKEKLTACCRKRADALEKATGRKICVISSGHTSACIEEQAEELISLHEAGAEAVIWITNRLDVENTSDAAWIRDAEKLISLLPAYIPLGLYECPTPYKRLISDEMMHWCIETGRFTFIKDTCCNEATIAKRNHMLRGSGIGLYNANAQTFLRSLQSGASGYCGVMANFHPRLYVWLFEHFKSEPEKAEEIAALLSLMSFTEALAFPITAKYHLSHIENVPMGISSRTLSDTAFSEYDILVLNQMKRIADRAEAQLRL